MHVIRILSVFFLLTATQAEDGPIIELPDGKIQGRIAATPSNESFYAFEKIPFATPPLGNLRFMAPLPAIKWSNVLNTTHLDVVCYAVNSNSDRESEDCLFINVFTPQLSGTPLPVLFFIFGGGFISGDSIGWRPEYLIEHNVLVVTFNYRVGPFGFLSTQDAQIPGNAGLKDQKLALEWTHTNVALFGGDPARITIVGQSAGAASVAYHLLHAPNTGLFRAAIQQSGSCLGPWALQRDAKEIAFKTAAYVNPAFGLGRNTTALAAFLVALDARTLDRATEMYWDHETAEDIELQKGFYWGPVLEVKHPDAFLTTNMYQLLKAGHIINVPVLMGINSEESIFDQGDEGRLRRDMACFDRHLDWLVPLDMKIESYDDRVEMGRRIRDAYTGGQPLTINLGHGVRYFSDNAFTRSIIKQAELQSTYTNVYFYQFSYDGDLGGYNVHYDGCEWVGHGEELNYLWHFEGQNWNMTQWPESDQLTQRRMLEMWTNFAKTMNPTPEKSELLGGVQWPQVDVSGGDFHYLDIGNELAVKNRPKNETYAFWGEMYASLGYDNFDTY